jgi:hypothetical protein
MIGAALLRPETYEDVERDESAITQALAVVVIVAIARGIGAIDAGVNALILGLVSALIGWVIYSVVAYFVGSTLFRAPETNVTLGQVLRVLGFAQAPGVIGILAIIPVIDVIVAIILFFWLIATTIVAIRAAFDFSTGRAVATAIVAVIVLIIVSAVLGLIFGVGAAVI